MQRKIKKILPSLFIILFISGCSSTYYRYVPDKYYVYTYSNGRQSVELKLTPQIDVSETSHTINLTFQFSESLITAQTLKSIQLILYYKNEKGGITVKEIPISKSVITVSYWNERDMVRKVKENYNEDLFLLIDPNMNEIKYKSTNVVLFTLENTYNPGRRLEQFDQKLILEWKDKPQAVYNSTVTNKKFTKPFISGRPFG